jgi:undecaprenyl-diphosphatase
MDFTLALKALIMGLVEGVTEFLPISSTGHLILAGSLLDFGADVSTEIMHVFQIAIQCGAILAVVWEFRVKIAHVMSGLSSSDPKSQKFAINILIAFFPAVVLGLIFGSMIKTVLFKPVPVAIALVVGGAIILLVERRVRNNPSTVRVNAVEDMSYLDALKVGCVQTFALIPGTSRSGATIIGAMMLGLSRKAATEFSFFLAIPTLFGATVYSLYKARDVLSAGDLPLFTIGTVAAFASAFVSVRWLLRYISTHDFTLFACYRIVFGLLVLASSHYGWVVWAQ